MSSPTTQLWSAAQKRVAAELLEHAELFLFGDWSRLRGSFRPRLMPLLIGQSGLGKTHVIREGVARELDIPYLRLCSSGWSVEGAKGDPTMLRVQEFVANHDQGVIHIDELDKFSLGSDWSKFMLGEVYDLLDRNPTQPAKNMAWSDEVLSKLKHDFWIVGTGTWQDLWVEATRAKVGFGGVQSTDALIESVRRLVRTSDVVPAELLRRFNAELIIMPPASENDFREAAQANGICQLAQALHEPIDFAAAEQSNLGARWIEKTMGRLLLKARRENRLDLIPFRPFEPKSKRTVPHEDDDNELEPFDDPKIWLGQECTLTIDRTPDAKK